MTRARSFVPLVRPTISISLAPGLTGKVERKADVLSPGLRKLVHHYFKPIPAVNTPMKKSSLVLALTVLGLTASIYAQDYHEEFPSGEGSGRSRSNPFDARPDRSTKLRSDIDNLNQMFLQVDADMKSYHPNPKIRADYVRLLEQRLQLKKALGQRGATDPYRVGEQVRQMRTGLHRVEEQLGVPAPKCYRWH